MKRPPRSRSGPRLRAVSLAGGALALMSFLVFLARDTGGRHPSPRANVSAAHVKHQRELPAWATPGATAAYAVAARIPQVLDGIHCYCACDVSIGHHSLLSCFEDDHGAACEVCQVEATIAAAVSDRRGSLTDARDAVDARFQRL